MVADVAIPTARAFLTGTDVVFAYVSVMGLEYTRHSRDALPELRVGPWRGWLC